MDTPENSFPQSSIYQIVKEIAKKYEGKPTQEECRRVNSESLFDVITQHHIPGIIYTLQPLEKVLYDYWSFHSIGILQTEPNTYAVYDITNPQKRGDALTSQNFFYTEGSLEEVSQKVSERFGGDWNLDFQIDSPTSRRDPNDICVPDKIAQVKSLIESGGLTNPQASDVSPDSGKPAQTAMATLDATITCPLGIKYQYNAGLSDKNSPIFNKIRAQFSYGYA